MIIEGIAIAVAGMVAGGSVGTFITGKFLRPEKEIVEKVRSVCPYCTIDITGLPELDKINHLACITKSEEDIKREAERKAAEAAANSTDDTYRVEINQITSATSRGNFEWGWDFDTEKYYRFEWFVWRVSKNPHGMDTRIANGSEPERDEAKEIAEAHIELDKQRTLTYTV